MITIGLSEGYPGVLGGEARGMVLSVIYVYQIITAIPSYHSFGK